MSNLNTAIVRRHLCMDIYPFKEKLLTKFESLKNLQLLITNQAKGPSGKGLRLQGLIYKKLILNPLRY